MSANGDELDGSGEGRPSNSRERVLQAGLTEFAAAGFDGASIASIADRAGMNKQLIYHYFNSKRGLYDAVLEHALASTSPPAASQTMSEYLDFALHSSVGTPWNRVLGWEGLQHGDEEFLYAEQRRESLVRVSEQIAKLQREGRIPAEADPDMVTLVVVVSLIAPSVLPQITMAATGEDGDSPEFRARLDRVLRILLGIADSKED